jgi:hypothetical protein
VRIAGAIMKIEDLNGIKPEGIADDVWAKTAEAVVKANENELLSIKKNEADMKAEKEQLAVKYRDIESKYGTTSGEVAQLKKQLEEKSSDPDKENLKKWYESELEKNKMQFEGAKQENDKTLNELKKQNEDLSKFRHAVSVGTIFDDVAKDKKIDPAAYSFLRDVIIGKNGENFSATTIEGKDVYMDAKGKPVDTVLKEFLEAPTGKRFLQSGNSGGSANGGNGGSSGNGDGITHAQWASMDGIAKSKYAGEHHGNIKFSD